MIGPFLRYIQAPTVCVMARISISVSPSAANVTKLRGGGSVYLDDAQVAEVGSASNLIVKKKIYESEIAPGEYTLSVTKGGMFKGVNQKCFTVASSDHVFVKIGSSMVTGSLNLKVKNR